jgi:hypothetical protein
MRHRTPTGFSRGRLAALALALLVVAPRVVIAQRGGGDAAARNSCPAADSGKFAILAGDARAIADAAASHIDTILVEPRSMQLTLHDSVSLTGFVEIFAVDKSGQTVQKYAPLFTTVPDGVVCLRRGYVIAAKAGRTVLTIGAGHLRTNPRVTDARPGTRVIITVLP